MYFFCRPFTFSDERNNCDEPLPVPDPTKPDAVKRLAATALYIHFCNRVYIKLYILVVIFYSFDKFVIDVCKLFTGGHCASSCDAPSVPTP